MTKKKVKRFDRYGNLITDDRPLPDGGFVRVEMQLMDHQPGKPEQSEAERELDYSAGILEGANEEFARRSTNGLPPVGDEAAAAEEARENYINRIQKGI